MKTPGELRAWAGSSGGWGEVGSDELSPRYSKPSPRMRRRCRQGDDCPNWATHLGMANGVALMSGCEFHVARWVRDAAVLCRTCSDSGSVYIRRGDDSWDAADCPNCPTPDITDEAHHEP